MDASYNHTGYGLYYKGDKQLFALNTVFLVFAVVVVAYRFWVQRGQVPWYLPENILCLLALLSFAAQCGIVYVIVLRAHIGNSHRTLEEDSLYARMTTALQFPYAFVMGFIRASIVLFEIRLFGLKLWFRRMGYVLLALVAAWTITVFVLALTICDPIKYNWDKTIKGHCANTRASYEGIAGTGIVVDVLIFLAPLTVIWNLQTSVSHRILVSILFAIGLFDIIMGALRLLGLSDSSVILSTAFGIVEPAVAIFVASAPHYKVLYTQLAKYMSSTGSSISSLFRVVRGSRLRGKGQMEAEKYIGDDSDRRSSHDRGNYSTEPSDFQRSAQSATDVV